MPELRKDEGRGERSSLNEKARENGLNYGQYVGLNASKGLTVKQKIEYMKENGNFHYEKAGEKKKRMERERMEREKIEKEMELLKENEENEVPDAGV